MAKKEVLTNFIPIGRSLFEHCFWCEGRVFSRFEAWIYLLKEARFEDTKLYDGNKVIEVKRGQIYASIRFFANAWKWSPKKVLGYLDLLIHDKMIVKETAKETGQSLITICNYDKYNNLDEKRKQQRKRQGNSKETKYNTVNTDNTIIPPISPTGEDEEVEKSWKEDFNVYLELATAGYNEIISNPEFIKERQKYHPELNITLSLEKAFKDYWSTEKAWLKRKKGKTEGFNWVSTYKNALTNPQNKVYKQKGVTDEPKSESRLHPALRQ